MDKQTQAIEPGVRRRDFLVGAIAGATLPLGSMAWAASSDTSQTRSIMQARRLGNMEVSEIIDHLNENLGALRVELTSADLAEIEAVLSKLTVHGGRMNPMYMELVDVSA